MNNTQNKPGLVLALAKDIECRIAELRRIADEPVPIHLSENVDIEVRPQGDDDRVNIGRKGWGFTTVNYTDEGLILDVVAEEEIDPIHTASIPRDDLEKAEALAEG